MQLKPPEESGTDLHSVEFYGLSPRSITHLKINQKSGRLAVCRIDDSIEIWDINKPAATHIRTIPAPTSGTCEGLAWVDDRILTITRNGQLIEWGDTGILHERQVTGRAATAVDTFGTQVTVGTEEGYMNVFEVAENEIVYSKMLKRQEGRVTCLKYSPCGTFVVTGSLDFVRVFELSSGNVVSKMHLGRMEKGKATIVWCLEVLENLQIITGDSRGRLTVWDGKQGAETESIAASKFDILALTLDSEAQNLYCAGVEATIKHYSSVTTRKHGVEVKQWVRGIVRNIHSHDVLAMETFGRKLVCAGIDGYLSVSSYQPKFVSRYAPLLRQSADVAQNLALLQFPSYLEVWRLGESDGTVVEGRQVGIRTHPQKLLQLQSRKGAFIVDAKLSPNGDLLAYASPLTTKLFSLTVRENEQPVLEPVQLPETVENVVKIAFSPKSEDVFFFKASNEVVLQTSQTFQLDLTGVVTHAEVSSNGSYLLVGTSTGQIGIWRKKGASKTSKWSKHVTLPQYECPFTALKFAPTKPTVCVAYSDMKLLEYDYVALKFVLSTFLNVKKLSPIPQTHPVRNIVYVPDREEVLVLQTEMGIFSCRKVPEDEVEEEMRSGKKSKTSTGLAARETPLKITVVKQFEHIAHLSLLGDSDLVAVLLDYAQIVEQLPPALRKKKFGVS